MRSPATPRSDLYSVGVTLYELLTGILPITGNTNYEILMGHMHKEPVPPHLVAPLVPMIISNAVMRALAKDPATRFQTAEEFLRALELTPSAPVPEPGVTLPFQAGQPPASASQRSEPSLPSKTSFTTAAPQPPTTASGSQSAPLEDVTRKLAVYIGPVAKFVVKKLAAQTDDMDTIYREAAKQISSEADRATFLRSRKN